MPSSRTEVKEVETPWRLVRARVHVALSPQQLNNVTTAATQQAYANLLLRHSAVLGGVVAAHSGPLTLDGPPKIIDASPFAHVSARTTLLVFAPALGSVLTGVVTHIGPDHVGLSVHAAFHAVLSIDDVAERYRYEHDARTDERRWRFVPNMLEQSQSLHQDSSTTSQKSRVTSDLDITVRKHIRFAVISVKATRFGLFQMLASIDDRNAAIGPSLGVISSIPSKTEALVNDGTSDDDDDVVAQFDRRFMSRPKRKVIGEDLLTQGGSSFGSAFGHNPAPTAGELNVESENEAAADTANADVIVDVDEDDDVDFDINIGASGITINRIKEENAIRTIGEASIDKDRHAKKKTRKSLDYSNSSKMSLDDDGESVGSTPTPRKRKKSKPRSSDLSVRLNNDERNINLTSLTDTDGATGDIDMLRQRGYDERPLKSSQHSEKPKLSTMLADAVQAVEIGLTEDEFAPGQSNNSKLSQKSNERSSQITTSNFDTRGNTDKSPNTGKQRSEVIPKNRSVVSTEAGGSQPSSVADGGKASTSAGATDRQKRLKRKRASLLDIDEDETKTHSSSKSRIKSKKRRLHRVSLTPEASNVRRSLGGPSMLASNISREDALIRRKSK